MCETLVRSQSRILYLQKHPFPKYPLSVKGPNQLPSSQCGRHKLS